MFGRLVGNLVSPLLDGLNDLVDDGSLGDSPDWGESVGGGLRETQAVGHGGAGVRSRHGHGGSGVGVGNGGGVGSGVSSGVSQTGVAVGVLGLSSGAGGGEGKNDLKLYGGGRELFIKETNLQIKCTIWSR